MKNISLLFVVSIFILSCNSSKKATSQSGATSAYEILYQEAYGGKEEKSYEVITSQNDFEALAKKSGMDISKHIVDFQKNTIIVLHLGTKNTGGYSIGISGIEVQGETTYVNVETSAPKPMENVTMALTQPYCIALIDKNKNIVFRD